jgi:hypothetical protein
MSRPPPCCPPGGKNVKEEKAVVNSMNILVATPGRLLQHMDETPGFDCSNLQVGGAAGCGPGCQLGLAASQRADILYVSCSKAM